MYIVNVLFWSLSFRSFFFLYVTPFFFTCITITTTQEAKRLQQHIYRLASFFLSSIVKRKRETPAWASDRPMVLDNHRLCVLFILLYNWRQNQRVKRAYSQANWAHIRGNLLSLMTHTRVIIICIQNKNEGNTSGEKKKCYI